MATEYGKRLKAARKHAKLTQIQLSEKTGIPQSTISTAENFGHGSADTTTYATACGVNSHWLATGEGEMELVGAIDVQARWIDDTQPERAALEMTTALPTLAQALEVLASHLDGLCDSGRELVAQHLQTLARAPDSAKAKAGALASLSGSNLNQQNTVGAEETPSFLKK